MKHSRMSQRVVKHTKSTDDGNEVALTNLFHGKAAHVYRGGTDGRIGN